METELRAFLAIVDTGSFTAAARVVHRTQPAVSAAIQRLEDWAGARLFERTATGARATPAGQALLPHARAVLAALSDGQRAVHEIAGLAAGEVRLGAGATACTDLLPPYLAAFRADHPGVTVHLREGNHDRLQADLASGEIDLVVATRLSDVDPGGHVDPWVQDELVFVAAPGGAPDQLVTFWEGSAIRALLLRVMPEARIVMELGSVAAVRAHVEAGVGTALLSRRSVSNALARGELVLVDHPAAPIRRDLVLVHRGTGRLPPGAAALRRRLLTTPTPSASSAV